MKKWLVTVCNEYVGVIALIDQFLESLVIVDSEGLPIKGVLFGRSCSLSLPVSAECGAAVLGSGWLALPALAGHPECSITVRLVRATFGYLRRSQDVWLPVFGAWWGPLPMVEGAYVLRLKLTMLWSTLADVL